ncbi:MAG: hypothetical protein HDS50_01095 [Bacteroides sp.]|nr:hypothetical protein [Bacteroides sp.]
MAKRETINYQRQQAELFKRTEGYAANVGAIYREYLTNIINLVKNTEIKPGKPFSFSAYGYSKQVTPMLRAMYSRIYQLIRSGVEREWLKANEHTDGLVKAIFGQNAIRDNHFARYFQHNMDAMDAFFERKKEGLNLSQKVWKYTGIYKDELEDALDLAIGEGTPANRLATQVKKYLNEPDRFYRRFRVKTGEDKDGNPIYGRVWKRRVFDKETDSYKWVDDDPRKYHPGRGVYRSSVRNAQRLARTETNIAYRTSEYTRWHQLPFVIGIEIKLSNNHPEWDICDDLKGVYPKDFKWTGWHPNCRCYQQPILSTMEDVDDMLDAILEGKDPSEVKSAGEITDTPPTFKEWVKDNEERIEQATAKGTLPYFIKDNKGYVDDKFISDEERAKVAHIEANRKEYERLKADSNYKDVEFNPANGGLKAVHINHANHSNEKETNKYFEDKLSGTDLEIKCQNILYNAGYRCILLPEKPYDSNLGQFLKSLDCELDGVRVDIRSITTNGKNTIQNAIKDKRKQLSAYNKQFGYNGHSLILYFHKPELFDYDKIKKELGNTFKDFICVMGNGRIIKIASR